LLDVKYVCRFIVAAPVNISWAGDDCAIAAHRGHLTPSVPRIHACHLIVWLYLPAALGALLAWPASLPNVCVSVSSYVRQFEYRAQSRTLCKARPSCSCNWRRCEHAAHTLGQIDFVCACASTSHVGKQPSSRSACFLYANFLCVSFVVVVVSAGFSLFPPIPPLCFCIPLPRLCMAHSHSCHLHHPPTHHALAFAHVRCRPRSTAVGRRTAAGRCKMAAVHGRIQQEVRRVESTHQLVPSRLRARVWPREEYAAEKQAGRLHVRLSLRPPTHPLCSRMNHRPQVSVSSIDRQLSCKADRCNKFAGSSWLAPRHVHHVPVAVKC
jgi:hypothetical protein